MSEKRLSDRARQAVIRRAKGSIVSTAGRLSCRNCNEFKGTQTHARDALTGRRVPLFNPRRQQWLQHFTWSEEHPPIIGKTACGRATVEALRMNHATIVTARQHWVKAGLHPPDE